MDPDAALHRIRVLVGAMTDANLGVADQADYGMELAELVQSLDSWLIKDGHLPVAWQYGRRA